MKNNKVDSVFQVSDVLEDDSELVLPPPRVIDDSEEENMFPLEKDDLDIVRAETNNLPDVPDKREDSVIDYESIDRHLAELSSRNNILRRNSFNARNVYLVDYENVHEAGFDGVETVGLTDKDVVCIFTGLPSLAISIKTLSILNSAELQYFIVTQSKQAVDMCIASYMGYLIAENKGKEPVNYIVVSKDGDYDSMLQFWANMGDGSFSRRTNFTSDSSVEEFGRRAEEKSIDAVVVPPAVKLHACQKHEAIQKLLSENNVDNVKVNQVASLAAKHFGEKNIKQIVYRSLTSKFGQQEGLELYRLIKKML